MVSQACTINIWQLAVWCCSVWTFCAAAAYTRPALGQLRAAAVGQGWWKCRELGWPHQLGWLMPSALPDSTPTIPFSAVASYRNLSCRPPKLETEDLERLKNANGPKQVGCEQCMWQRLEQMLHGAMAVCFTQGCSVAAGCSPALSNMTSPTFTFGLKWSTLKQCLPVCLFVSEKKISFSDYSLYAECVYVS